MRSLTGISFGSSSTGSFGFAPRLLLFNFFRFYIHAVQKFEQFQFAWFLDNSSLTENVLADIYQLEFELTSDHDVHNFLQTFLIRDSLTAIPSSLEFSSILNLERLAISEFIHLKSSIIVFLPLIYSRILSKEASVA